MAVITDPTVTITGTVPPSTPISVSTTLSVLPVQVDSISATASLVAQFDSTLGSASLTLGSNFVLPTSLTLNILGATSLTINDGSFQMTGGKLVKAGAGTLTLSGANSYTGGTEVQAGTLRVDPSSIIGNVTVDSGATLDLVPIAGQENPFGGAISLAGGSAFIDFSGVNTTINGASTSFGALTIRNFQLSDRLRLDNFTDVKHTTASVSGGVLTVTDTTHSAVFSLTGSLSDDANETVVVLRNSASGTAVIVPAIDVTSPIGDDTGPGSLRHALSVIGGPGQGNAEVVLFDHIVSGTKFSVGGATVVTGIAGTITSANPLVIPMPTNLPAGAVPTVVLDVQSGDSVTIDGGAGAVNGFDGGLHATSGFFKAGGGTLGLTGDQAGLGGTVTVGGGGLDVETSLLGAVSFAFKTGVDATIAGTSATLSGKSFTSFDLGDSIKLNDFDRNGSTTFTNSAGTLLITETNPNGVPVSASLSVSGQTDYVLLSDSIDGTALIRPALAASDETTLRAAVTTITSLPYSNTSGDVIDLSGATGTTITLTGSLALPGSNKILFDTNGSSNSVTIQGALSGSGNFQKVGAGTLTLLGDESGLGTISVSGGVLGIGSTLVHSTVTAVDLSSGHATVAGTASNLNGVSVQNFHLGNAIDIAPVSAGDSLSITLSGGSLIITETGSTPGSYSLTPSFSAGSGFTTATDVSDGHGGRAVIPVITGTVVAAPGDLGSFTAITGTLDLTQHGVYGGKFFGTGTIAVDLSSGTQEVSLSSAVAGIGTGNFTGEVVVDQGILDLSSEALTSTIHASLVGAHAGAVAPAQLNVSVSANQHLTFDSIAAGSALDITNLSYASLDTVDSGVGTVSGGGTVLQLFTGTVSTHSLAFQATVPAGFSLGSTGGGLQILADDSGLGTLVAFGNQTITATANVVAAGGTLGTGVRPTTLKIIPSASPTSIVDLSSLALIGPAINSLDLTALGSATIALNATEFNSLKSITASGATLRLGDGTATAGGFTFHGENVDFTGISSVDFAGHADTLIIQGGGGGSHPQFFHGNPDGSDTISVTSSTIDLSNTQFSGDGHIVSTVVGGTAYTLGDGGVIPHITFHTGDSIILTAGAPFTADEIGYALSNGFTLRTNGPLSTPLTPGAPFTPPGGSPAVLAGLGALTSLTPLDVTALGATHIVLPPGAVDMSNLTFANVPAGQAVVLFGSPGGTVHLPNSPPGGNPIEFEVNAGNNTITAGSAGAEIWGGSGHDIITLTSAPGTVVGGSGFATLSGGSASGTAFGGSGTVILFGGQSGGSLSGGGDFSILVSEGGQTTLTANPAGFAVGSSVAGAIHQALIGAKVTDSTASDHFFLSPCAGAQDVVEAGSVSTTVIGGAGGDTVIGSTGAIQVIGGAASEKLLFVAGQSTGGTEHSVLNGGSAGQVVAYGGDGMDQLSTGTGYSTLIGGIGTDIIGGSTGNGYMLGQGTKDVFTFLDSGASTGAFIVEGFHAATDKLVITSGLGGSLLSSAHLITLAADANATIVGSTAANTPHLIRPDDALTAHLVGVSALEMTLASGQRIDLVGVAQSDLTLNSNFFVGLSLPPA